MIAEQLVREALGAPTPQELARRRAVLAHAACQVRLSAAKARRDFRAIHAAQKALSAATVELLRVGA